MLQVEKPKLELSAKEKKLMEEILVSELIDQVVCEMCGMYKKGYIFWVPKVSQKR